MLNLLKINSLFILIIFSSQIFCQEIKTEVSFQTNIQNQASFWSKSNQQGLDLSEKNLSVINETKLKNSLIFFLYIKLMKAL